MYKFSIATTTTSTIILCTWLSYFIQGLNSSPLAASTLQAHDITRRAAETGVLLTNGNFEIGISTTGHLVNNDFGFKFKAYPGMYSDGWGVSGTIMESGKSFAGYTSYYKGDFNVTLTSLISNESEAVVVSMLTTGELEITHHYKPSPFSTSIYECTVTLRHVGRTNETMNNLRYRRTTDWDVEPNPRENCVDIVNVTSTDLEYAMNDWVDFPDPRDSNMIGRLEPAIFFSCPNASDSSSTCNRLGIGPEDQAIDFIVFLRKSDRRTPRILRPNEKTSFKIYFGADDDTVKLRSAFASLPTDERPEFYGLAYNPIEVMEERGLSIKTCNNSIGNPAAFGFGYSPAYSLEPTTKAPTKAPTMAPTNAPSTSPSSIPTATRTRKSCGLFGLSIFCPFTLCGIFGRFIGLCE